MRRLTPNTPDTERRDVFGTGPLSGWSLALLFWWQSLTPTLIPRSWETQSVVSAICLAIGYGIGAFVVYWAHRLLDWPGRSTGNAIRRHCWVVVRSAWLVGVLLGPTLWKRWQGEQRNVMSMASLAWFDAVLVGVVSPSAGILLVVSGRVVVNGVVASTRFIVRHVPAVVPISMTVVLIVLLSIMIGRGTVLRAVTAVAYYHYAPRNDQTTEGLLPPDSSVSGSRNSFVAWDTLGRIGRDFVATATTMRDLQLFHHVETELKDPGRVYVGVRSADSAAARAALAVRELERAGGFDRKVLVVWVPTGTGWMIPKAAALEQLHGGDTAIVASWESMPGHQCRTW